MSIIYLGAPYTHASERVRRERVELASLAAARLMMLGNVVFSPITHGHHVADHLPRPTRESHRFWMDQCKPFMESCSQLVILPLDGWRASKGLQEEILYFHLHRKPIRFIMPPESDLMFQEDGTASVLYAPFEHELRKWNASTFHMSLTNVINGPWPEQEA